ncbi:MAG: Gfo/Idh/MocA family oxidoreductase [Candidatus Symbiodolus clandestinus]
MFQDKNIDMVVILSHNHESLINHALDSGKHVFTEKPISLDIDYSKRLVKKAKDLKLALEVGLMRFHDKVIKSFFNQVLSKDIVSGFFYKADGSDQIIREVMIPGQLKAYNFGKIDPPKSNFVFNDGFVTIKHERYRLFLIKGSTPSIKTGNALLFKL